MGMRVVGIRQHHAVRTCTWLVLACAHAAAFAISPNVRLADLPRSEWSRLHGAPAATESITRASDGMLWVGGRGGLHRFDGVRFHAFRAVDGTGFAGTGVVFARPGDNGALWLGLSDGQIVRVHGEDAMRWGPVAGLHDGGLTGLAVGTDNRVWVTTQAGLTVLQNGQWRAIGADAGLTTTKIDDVALADDGRAWVLASEGLFVGDADNTRFALVEAMPSTSHMSGLVLRGEEVWRWRFTGDDNLCRLLPATRRSCWTATNMLDPRFDAHGALWWRAPDGIRRVLDPDSLGSDASDLLRRAEHVDIAADSFTFGSDGSLWLAESDRIERLRESPLQHLRTPSGAVVAADDGSIWLGSFTRGLMRIGVPPADAALLRGQDDTLWTQAAVDASADLADMMSFEPHAPPLQPDTPVVLARYPDAQARTAVRVDADAAGGVLVATLSPPRLVRHDGTVATEIALPPFERGAIVRGVRRDAAGDLWLAVARHTVPFYRLRDGQWQEHGGVAGVDRAAINGFAFDADDALWIAIGPNAIGRARAGTWTRFGEEHGVDLGMAIQPLVRDGQAWFTGAMGVQGFVDGRLVSLVGNDGDRFAGASGALQLDNGELWLHGIAGLSRIAREEWQRALREPGHRVAYTRFDHFDGNMAGAMQGAPMPTLAQSRDGTLWATTDAGIVRIDPARIRPALPAPAVQLLSLHVDNVPHALSDGVALPVGATRIGIAFATPPTDQTERIRLRYRLRGSDWIDAGDRRDVVYEALPPGDHVFEAVASDRDGRWGDTPTRLAFSLPPRFHQTTAFHVLLGLAIVLALAALYAVRMRQVAERTRRETTARLHERMRIARDLHDTLLQDVQALHMHVQAIGARVPDDDPLRPRIDLVLDRAQDTIREGRDRIGTLRDPLVGTGDFADCLRRIAQRVSREAGIACDVHVATPARALQTVAYDELLHIGREALTNAARHARATRLCLRIAFDDDALRVSVSDDGDGLPLDMLERDGHFGLRGMHERAAVAGAQLQVHNLDGGGAEVTIRVPAPRAYLHATPQRGWLERLLRGTPRHE